MQVKDLVAYDKNYEIKYNISDIVYYDQFTLNFHKIVSLDGGQ